MKKFLITVFLFALIFSVTGCGEPEPKHAVLEKETDGVTALYELDAADDTVHRILFTTTKDCSSYVNAQMDIIRSSVSSMETAYAGIDGVTYEPEFTDKELIETITIDLTKEGVLTSLSENELMVLTADEGDTVSLSSTIEELKKDGWTVIEAPDEE